MLTQHSIFGRCDGRRIGSSTRYLSGYSYYVHGTGSCTFLIRPSISLCFLMCSRADTDVIACYWRGWVVQLCCLRSLHYPSTLHKNSFSALMFLNRGIRKPEFHSNDRSAVGFQDLILIEQSHTRVQVQTTARKPELDRS